MVGEVQAVHGGLLTNWKNDRLNHLRVQNQVRVQPSWKLEAYFKSALITQS